MGTSKTTREQYSVISPIYSLAIKCKAAFGSLCQNLRVSCYGSLEDAAADEATRFEVWGANIGALRSARSASSLDSRLNTSDRFRKIILSDLERLQGAVVVASEIALGSRPNRTTGSFSSEISVAEHTARLIYGKNIKGTSSPATELAELFFNMRSCITNLFKLSVLLRRDRPYGRTHQQDRVQRGNFQAQDDAGPDIIHVKDKFPKLQQRPWLAERIGKNINQQRDYIRYRQEHSRKLEENAARDEGSDVLSLNATTKATTFVDKLDVVNEIDETSEDLALTGGSIMTTATSFATTTLGDTGSGRKIPMLTEMWLKGVHLDYGNYIECPYCRTIQIIADELQWKRHVYRDLRAYSCTFKNCTSEPFQTSHDWFKHELDNHRRQWKCHWCSEICDSSSSLEAHFVSQHPSTLSAEQMKILINACERAVLFFDDAACPLCNKWQAALINHSNSTKFRSHVAKHLQELAREALPLAIHNLEIREDEEASRQIRNRESDVESVSTENSDATHSTPTLAYMAPCGKFVQAEEHWRCLVNVSSGLCQTRSSRLEDLRRHAKAAHPEIKAARFVCHSACPECGKVLAGRECDDCTNPPDSEVWIYAPSKDRNHLISFEADRKQRSMLNVKIAGEVRRNMWRNSFMTGMPARREEGMDQDPFMNAYLVREGGHPSFEPSDSENMREEFSVIKFTDMLDRTFHFPLSICSDYPTMIDMVKMAFLYEDFAQVVMAGHFELVNSEGVVISQVIWSRVVGPGFVARMRLLQTPISTKTGYSDAEEEPDSLDEQVNPRVDPKAQSGDGVSFEASADLPPTRRPDSLRPSVSTVETVEMAKTTATPNSHAEIDRAPTVSSPRSLGCEFKPWTGCQRSFGLEEDEVGQWIRHAEDDHLRGDYPSRCICWFCDDVEFRAEQSFDAGMNFEYRMRHIADHILEGCRFENRRPDFHFLDHVYDMGLISSEAFALAKDQSEGAPAPAGVSSSGFRPPRRSSSEPVVEVIESSRRRQRNRLRHL